MAFQGHVNVAGQPVPEVFIVDLPDDLIQPGDAPLEGTPASRPTPPKGTAQRRLTYTTHQKYPGLQGPRHWLRSAPDGSAIAYLRKDPQGIVQLFTITPNGGDPRQITNNQHSISSAFTWHPGGQPEAEIKWILWDSASEGQGLAFEAAVATRAYAFDTLGWTTAASFITPDNTRSIALATKLGATPDRDWHTPRGTLVTIWRHPNPQGAA